MIIGHGGNIAQAAAMGGLRVEQITDMSSNTNPLGPMPGMMAYLKNRMNVITRLPEADAHTVVWAFAGLNGLDPSRVLAAGGTTQFIYALPRLFSSSRALILGPTYSDYGDACAINGMNVTFAFPDKSQGFAHDPDRIAMIAADCDLVFLCNPNNPTGDLFAPDTLGWLARKCPATVFILDESYLPFIPESASLSMAGARLPNILVLSSFSKIYKVPGLRIGFAIAPKRIKERLARFQMPWSMGSLAQEAVLFAANNKDAALGYIEQTAAYVAQERKLMAKKIKDAAGITMYQGVTPFVLFQLPQGVKSAKVWKDMLAQGVLVRDCANFQGLGPRFVRLSLKDKKANAKAADFLISLAGKPSLKGNT